MWVCVTGVLASVGVSHIFEEECNWECCIGPGACDGFTGVRVCQDSASCSGEGVWRNARIDDVFLRCEGTGACYNAGDGGGMPSNGMSR